jgi:hypothetical protein
MPDKIFGVQLHDGVVLFPKDMDWAVSQQLGRRTCRLAWYKTVHETIWTLLFTQHEASGKFLSWLVANDRWSVLVKLGLWCWTFDEVIRC